MSRSSGKWFWKLTRWARAMRFWIFLALAAVAWLGFGGEASAGTMGCDNGMGCDRGEALQACELHGSTYQGMVADRDVRCRVHSEVAYACEMTVTGGSTWSACGIVSGPSSPHRTTYYHVGCPAGTVWNEAQKQCSADCANVSPLGTHSAIGSWNVCSDGCQFTQGAGICLGNGPDMYCYANEWTPTGQQCQVGDATPQSHNPNDDTCRSTGGGWNECVKPNGEHCVTGPKGTRMCWQPGEMGHRNDTRNIEWADRVPVGETPTPPANIENPTEETTTADKGGVSGDAVGGSFVIGGGSGTGNTGGQNNTGTGGSGSGDGDDGDGGSVSGGGTCGAPPICSGDAVMCAINEGTWRARCAGSEGGDDAIGDLNDAIADGDDDADLSGLDDASDPSNWQEVEDMSDHVLDESGFAGGGNCPVLPSFSVGPSSVTISLTPLCDLLVSLSSLVMGLAYFMGFKIIAGVK